MHGTRYAYFHGHRGSTSPNYGEWRYVGTVRVMLRGVSRRVIAPLGAAALLLSLIGIFWLFHDASLVRPTETPAGDMPTAGWYGLYFTDPQGPTAATLRGGPDRFLAEAIDSAHYSVDVAVYDLNLWSIRDSLLRAHRRGVDVRLVIESDNILEPEVESLSAAGIPVLGDRRESLMHHKFVVIDRQDVWTGSMNLTVGGAYRDNNNLIRVRSNQVAEDYTREFEEMFVEDRFGVLSLADTPYPVVIIDGHQVEVLFSPDDGVALRILALLRNAQRSIDLLAYSFTSDAIGEVLLERAQDQVKVRAVVEAGQVSAAGAETERLREAGLDIRLDGNPGNMHHKVIIIDDVIVITGSYNFTRSAEEHNDENVLILHDPEIADRFLEEFEGIYSLAVR